MKCRMVGNSPLYDPFAMARIAALLPLSFCTGQLSETGEDDVQFQTNGTVSWKAT